MHDRTLMVAVLLLGLSGCNNDAPMTDGPRRDAVTDAGPAAESSVSLEAGQREGGKPDLKVGDGAALDRGKQADASRIDAPKPKVDAAKPDAAKPDLGVKPDGAAPGQLQGYWVWKQEVDNGSVVLTITDADMVGKVGPTGWPGCPTGILCTHYGIRKLAFGPTGKGHYIYNVMTSSDYQFPGTYSVAGDVVTYVRLGKYSCAHPNDLDSNQSTRYFRYKMVGADELWVGVTTLGTGDVPWATTAPPASPTRWVVYKRITKTEFYGKYMIRICQPVSGYSCNAGCSSMTLVD